MKKIEGKKSGRGNVGTQDSTTRPLTPVFQFTIYADNKAFCFCTSREN